MRSQDAKYGSVVDLFAAGILRIAVKPPANPSDVSGASFLTVPLIAADYEARTPAMWNAAYREFGMPELAVMAVADPKHTAVILEAFRRDPRYRGGGCGVGFKQVVISHLDEVEQIARAIGAVNIIRKMPDGRLAARNTDGVGYYAALEETLRPRKVAPVYHTVLLIGAGGSAQAIAYTLAKWGNAVYIANRTAERARELAVRLNGHFNHQRAVRGGGLELIPDILPEADIVIAAVDDTSASLDAYSPLGPMTLPVTAEHIRQNREATHALLLRAKPDLVVSDIRIRKEETPLLRQARALGFKTLDGIPMVIYQGIEAFWWLYGEMLARRGIQKEDVARIMRQAADAA